MREIIVGVKLDEDEHLTDNTERTVDHHVDDAEKHAANTEINVDHHIYDADKLAHILYSIVGRYFNLSFLLFLFSTIVFDVGSYSCSPLFHFLFLSDSSPHVIVPTLLLSSSPHFLSLIVDLALSLVHKVTFNAPTSKPTPNLFRLSHAHFHNLSPCLFLFIFSEFRFGLSIIF